MKAFIFNPKQLPPREGQRQGDEIVIGDFDMKSKNEIIQMIENKTRIFKTQFEQLDGYFKMHDKDSMLDSHSKFIIYVYRGNFN